MTATEQLLPTSLTATARGAGASELSRSRRKQLRAFLMFAVSAFLLTIAMWFTQRIPRFTLPSYLDSWSPITPQDELFQSLSNRRLVYIGDSLTRYQYLELTYYLETGLIPSTSNASTLVRGKWDPTNQLTWPDWDTFFQQTSISHRGVSHCDCYRTKELPLEQTWENRYYDAGDVHLEFHQLFKDVGVCSLRGTQSSVPSQSSPPTKPDWCQTVPSFIASTISLHPTVTIVLNGGLHEPFSPATFDHVLKVVTDTNATLIWKTTTPDRNGRHVRDPPVPVHLPNVKVLNTSAIVDDVVASGRRREDLYFDHLHFVGEMSHRFNMKIVEDLLP
ncbi:hypothetical protein HKX48_007679 [Thoreauomyces humboldtii]|nr:hypothetical protein HKX48_007679 [Thoreauomyces humboldtii]